MITEWITADDSDTDLSCLHRGPVGDEVNEEGEFHFTKTRRRSNSSAATHDSGHFKTKFDVNEQEPVFEEALHGPPEELSQVETSSSNDSTGEGKQH